MRHFFGSLLWLACLPALACAQTTVPDSTAGSDAAKTVFNDKIKPYAGSAQAVQNNLLKPLVSGGTLKSIDGTTSFAATSLTTSNQPLMQVSVFGNPPTGDILKILVEQDTAGSGSFNAASIFPMPSEASGQMIASVCANGYVMCDPGTYSNCRFREWTADSTGLITAIPAGAGGGGSAGNISTLSGCYCFNKACTRSNSAILNIDNITSNVGGGLLAAFLSAKPAMMVTGAQSSGAGQITYYGVSSSAVPTGADTTKMTAEEIAAMPVMPSVSTTQIQSYYKNPNGLTAMASAAETQQRSTPGSLFNTAQAAALRNAGSTISCSNMMTPQLVVTNKVVSSAGGQDGQSKVCVDHQTMVVLTQTDSGFAVGNGYDLGNACWAANCNGGPSFSPELNKKGYLVGSVNLGANNYGFEIASATLNMTFSGGGCSTAKKTLVWTPAVGKGVPFFANTPVFCEDHRDYFPSYEWTLDVDLAQQEVTEIANMACKQYETDANCILQQESWDGRPVVVNGMATGFTMTTVFKDLSGPIRAVHYPSPPNRPWFRQDKVFYCKNPTAYDFTEAGKRAKGIQDSSKMPTDSSATYTDGGATFSFGVPQKGVLPACSQVCRTKVPATDSAMLFTSKPASSNLTANGVTEQSWSFFYKDCIGKADGSWECPLDTANGEQLVTACGCSSDLGTVIGALTAANEAAQDSICSKK
ncbi:hypothetical protein [Geomonas subterranea]|uniref:hypothetical protein n=1 Tax=Geomonas subterranea TaxID=2847989 RepID=UPI001CD47C36|nr:hypothetical protein [Geomonas fuzhouensis]